MLSNDFIFLYVFFLSKWHWKKRVNAERERKRNINRGEGGATKLFLFIFFLLNMCECVFFSIVCFWSRKRKKRNQLNQIVVTEWYECMFIFLYTWANVAERLRGMYRKPQVIFYEINSISIACFFPVCDVQNVGLSFLKHYTANWHTLENTVWLFWLLYKKMLVIQSFLPCVFSTRDNHTHIA